MICLPILWHLVRDNPRPPALAYYRTAGLSGDRVQLRRDGPTTAPPLRHVQNLAQWSPLACNCVCIWIFDPDGWPALRRYSNQDHEADLRKDVDFQPRPPRRPTAHDQTEMLQIGCR